MNDEVYALLFSVRRSVRYHVKRRQFFDRVQNTCSFLGMLAGGAAATALAAKYDVAIFLAIVASAVSGLALVSRASVRARDHNDLAKAFIELEIKLLTSNGDLAEHRAKRLSLEAGEPPILRVLDTVCHNELCIAMKNSEYTYELSFWRRALAHFSDFGWIPDAKVAAAHRDNKSGGTDEAAIKSAEASQPVLTQA